MSLLKRLTIAIFSILILFAFNVATFVVGNNTIRDSLDQVSDAVRGQSRSSAVRQTIESVNKQLLVFKTLYDTGGERISETEAERTQTQINSASELIISMERDVNDDSRPVYEKFRSSAETLFAVWREQLDYLTKRSQSLASVKELRALYADTLSLQGEFDEAVINVSREQSSQVEQTGRVISRITAVIFLVSIFVTSLLGFLLIRHTNESLRRLREGTIEFGSGNFEHQIPVLSRDELGELAESFNAMAAKLRAAIDEVQAAKDQADRANEAKSGFLANMSHELRTPLNAIIGYSEMVVEMATEDEEMPAAELVDDAQRILTAGRHLLSLINNVLDLAKIETGKMTVYKERFKVSELIDELIGTMKPLAEKNQNELVSVRDDEALEIVTDITKLRQIITNLVSNACKFTEKGRVEIRTRHISRHGKPLLLIEVKDSGIGMTPEQLAVVFEAFVQADSSTTKRYGGTGLGLSLCKEFAQLLEGDISVTSKPGEGSCFRLELPLGIEMDASREPSKKRNPDTIKEDSENDDDALCVLVVDDDNDARELTLRAMRLRGCRVIEAISGKTGLELAIEKTPDLIILDLVMPDTDGWTVLDALKQNPRTRHIPVIVQSMLDERDEGLKRGATAFLSKPVNRHNLAAAMDKLLPRQNKGHALVIDQGLPEHDKTVDALRDQGWIVSTVDHPSDANLIARQNPPALTILRVDPEQLDDMEELPDLLYSGGLLSDTPTLACSAGPIDPLVCEQLSAMNPKTEFIQTLDSDTLLETINRQQRD